MDTGAKHVLKRQVVLGFNSALYQEEKLFVETADGFKLPITSRHSCWGHFSFSFFVVSYRIDKRDSKNGNPGYLRAYGAYGDLVELHF